MGYKVTEGTIKWARHRVKQINDAEVDIGAALEKMTGVADEIRSGCNKMDDQWDSDIFRSYANDLEKILETMNERFDELRKDRNVIAAGIREYEGANENGNDS